MKPCIPTRAINIDPYKLIIFVFLWAAELVKKQELEKDELRPLYMDFQATTPMVTISNCDAVIACPDLDRVVFLMRVLLGPKGVGCHVALPSELLW